MNFTYAPSFMDPSQSWRPRSDPVVPLYPAVAFHPPLELYDLREDPGETRNLATVPAYAPVLRDLQAQLARHLKETDDPILAGAVTNPIHRRDLAWLDSV